MSQRGMTAAALAELAKGQNAPAHLVELQFASGTVYLTDSYRSVSWNGNTYTAAGHLLSFSGLVESAELRISELRGQLSGVDQTIIALALANDFIDRRLVIYKAFFDTATQALIVDPFSIHDGRMSEATLNEDPDAGTSVVEIVSRDQFADFERRAGRYTNPQSQNLFFPTDRSFDLVAQNAGSQVVLTWGAVRP